MGKKILFLCGSCESGKDGVGDYTVMLAAQLSRMNQNVSLIALNDKHTILDKEESFDVDGTVLKILRLSKDTAWNRRLASARNWIQAFAPDWISIQYVPFSFNDKGLPFGFAHKLKKLLTNARVHIMFHEIWVGIKKNSPASHSVYKFFQKKIAASLTKKLRPALVNTSNRVYQLELQRVGIESDILPLFSNIPISQIDEAFVDGILRQAGISKTMRHQFEIICVFGSIFPDIKLDAVIEEQVRITGRQEKHLLLVFMGRTNNDEVARLKQQFEKLITVLNLGELSAQKVSSMLQVADKAISITPKEFIGKSGVYAVLKRHNLPVLSPFSITIPQYQAEIEKQYRDMEAAAPGEWDVKNVAKKLYDNFSLHTNI